MHHIAPDSKPLGLSEQRAAATEEEARLLARVAAGDNAAFETLYRAYYPRLTRFLEQTTRSPSLIDEILDDTMMVIWRKAGTFNGQSRVSTWIFAIAYNRAMKTLGRERRAGEDRGDPTPEATERGPETEFMEKQARLQMRRLLGRLSVEHRAVMELTYYFGYACKEIAEIVGCPVDTVKTRMFHARRKLRAMLLALEEDLA